MKRNFILLLLVIACCAEAQDFAENNASSWSVFASDNAAVSVSNDTTHVKVGSASIKFVTLSGFDTGVKYPAASNAHWNLTGFNTLQFWEYAVNTTPIGFQGNQPIVVLKCANGGSYTYTPSTQQTFNYAWHRVIIPLAGNSDWVRTSSGSPNLTDVNQFEIHHDTWDYGFTIYFDGVQFSTFTPGGLPPAGPLAPPGVNPNGINPRVLLYIYNPIMPNKGGVPTDAAYNWGDSVTLTNGIISDFIKSSHGLVHYQVVDTITANEFPYFTDGFQYDPYTFDRAWTTRSPHNSLFDYARFVTDKGLVPRIESGDIDEIWIYAPPFFQLWESNIVGNGGYWCNSGPTPGVTNRIFVVMGWNFERGVAEAIHSYGHRAESILARQYGNWAVNQGTTWNKFALLNKDAPGLGGIGNVHYPVNGVHDYDYDNLTSVTSNCDDWYNFPNFLGVTRSVNSSEWSPTHLDPPRDYLNWWYNHMPHYGSKSPDQFLQNWWRYLTDIDPYKTFAGTGPAGTGPLYYADGSMNVSVTSPSAGTVVSGFVPITASASVNGALGRVDLYIDGQYWDTDTEAPFNFICDTSGLSGSHTLQVKSYELQNGTEAVSSPISVTVNNAAANYSLSGTITAGITGVSGVTIQAVGGPTKNTRVSSGQINLAIPDNNTSGISSALTISGTGGKVNSLTVRVTIQHSNRPELELYLSAPDGTNIRLFNHSPGVDDRDLITFYPDLDTPDQDITQLKGKTADGVWTLLVKDTFSGHVGTLQSWSLKINSSVYTSYSTTTTSDGRYIFNSLPVGLYTITPIPVGTKTYTPKSRIIYLSGHTYSADAKVSGTTVNLNGTIKLANWIGNSLPVIRISIDGGPLIALSINQTSIGNGTFVIPIVSTGTHTVLIHAVSYLTEKLTVTPGGQNVSLIFDGNHDQSAGRTPGQGLIPGDLTGDNIVDDSDLLMVINNFLTTYFSADTNGDNLIDDSDLLNIINYFLSSGDN